jgi:hypothetical protein
MLSLCCVMLSVCFVMLYEMDIQVVELVSCETLTKHHLTYEEFLAYVFQAIS